MPCFPSAVALCALSGMAVSTRGRKQNRAHQRSHRRSRSRSALRGRACRRRHCFHGLLRPPLDHVGTTRAPVSRVDEATELQHLPHVSPQLQSVFFFLNLWATSEISFLPLRSPRPI